MVAIEKPEVLKTEYLKFKVMLSFYTVPASSNAAHQMAVVPTNPGPRVTQWLAEVAPSNAL